MKSQNATKLKMCLTINPALNVNNIYLQREYISERERLAFTRFRLSSHNLKKNTGRWLRLPRGLRLCICKDRGPR